MSATRTTVRFALGFALLVAIAILITMTRGGGLQLINGHDQLQVTHAVAPASLNQAQAPTISNTATGGMSSTLPAESSNASNSAAGAGGAGKPSGIVTRAGPDDAGPGVGYSTQIQPQSCSRKPCRQ